MRKRDLIEDIETIDLMEDVNDLGDCERELRGMDEDWGEPPAWLREVRANGAKVQGRVAR